MKRRGNIWLMLELFVLGLAVLASCSGDGGSTGDDDDDTSGDDDTSTNNILVISDPTVEAWGYAQWLDENYRDDLNTSEFVVELDWRWDSGSGMGVQLMHYYEIYAEVMVDMFDWGEGPQLEVMVGPGEWQVCFAPLERGRWYRLKLIVDPASKRYSVYLDDQQTACVDFPFLYGNEPLGSFAFMTYMDASGGTSCFDNVRITNAAGEVFREDFEDDVAGSVPSQPWQMYLEGISVEVVAEQE